MQLLTEGQRPLREELHLRDSGLESGERRSAVHGLVVDRFDDQTHALILAEAKILGRLQKP